MMRTIVSPDVLHLIGVGSDGSDPYLRRGRHLRWFPNALLGFPRRGFLLRRRPSPPWPWAKELIALDALLADGSPASGGWVVDARGYEPGNRRLRVTSPAGSVSPSAGAVQPGSAGIMLEPLDGTRPDPCAWVALQVSAPPGTDASVTATAWSRGPGDDQAVVASVSARVEDLEPWNQATSPTQVGRVLLVDGGLVDAVEVHASPGVTLTRVGWITTARYAQAGGWSEVARLLLPIEGDGTTYPAQSDIDAVIDSRLAGGAAPGAPPWAAAVWPPPARTDSVARAAAVARHGPHLPHLQDELTRILAAEIADGVAQGLVPPAMSRFEVEGGGDATFETRPIPLLLGAALEFPVAHLLGLAAHDPDPPVDVPHDYCVTAWYPTAWLVTLSAPDLAARFEDHPLVAAMPSRTRTSLLVPPLPPQDPPSGTPMFIRAASIATALVEVPLPPVAPPTDVSAVPAPGRGSSPIGIDAEVRWRTAAPLDARHGPVVAATQIRADPAGRVPLARTDPLSGEPVPTLSGTGEHVLIDRTVGVAGPTTWDVHDHDLWGRWSAPMSATFDVVDLPPPAPTGLQAQAEGPPDPAGGTVASLEVAFDWTPAHLAAAPDTIAFDVRVVAGDHPAAAAIGLLGADVEVDLDGTTPTSGATAQRRPSPEGGARYTVRLTDVPATRSNHTWTATVVVRARDEGGNRSEPVAVPADVVEEARPAIAPGLPGVQRTSWPDPEGRGWFRMQWTPVAGGRVQVMRASGARLLAAAGRVRDVDADDDDHAAELRALAVDHPHAFSPDHPRSYDEDVVHHDVAVPGGSRDLVVLVVVPSGPTGSRAAWPTSTHAFTVVGARRRITVGTPRLTVSLNAAGAAVLTVTGSSGPGRVRAWRADDAGALVDVRRMRPLPPMVPDASGTATLVDSVVAPARWYAYRAVCVTPDGRRSAPTQAVWVRTRDA